MDNDSNNDKCLFRTILSDTNVLDCGSVCCSLDHCGHRVQRKNTSSPQLPKHAHGERCDSSSHILCLLARNFRFTKIILSYTNETILHKIAIAETHRSQLLSHDSSTHINCLSLDLGMILQHTQWLSSQTGTYNPCVKLHCTLVARYYHTIQHSLVLNSTFKCRDNTIVWYQHW